MCFTWIIYWLDHYSDSLISLYPETRHNLRINAFLGKYFAGPVFTIGTVFSLIFIYNQKNNPALIGCLLFPFGYLLSLRIQSNAVKTTLKTLFSLLSFFCVIGLVPFFSQENTSLYKLIPSVAFVILCFQNLLLLSFFDNEYDTKNNFSSIVNVLKKPKSVLVATWILLLILCFFNPNCIPFGVASSIQTFILLKRKYFKENQNYRFWADASLLVSLFFLY